MKHYEKIILKVDKLCAQRKILYPNRKIIALNPKHMVECSFNQPKPYRGDYFEQEDK